MFYLIKQGFENILKNKLMFFASVLIVATTMITLSIFVIIGENVQHLVDNMQGSQGVIAYLEKDLQDEQISVIKAKLKSIAGITDIEYESKEQALENARKEYFDESNMDLTVGWEENNIFTASFTVSLNDLEEADKVTQKIKQIDGIRKVVFDNEIFNTITEISNLVRIIVMGIFILLVGVSFLVISNTIKLVLHSRRKEINIMKYIGATNGFVETPFIIEGIIVGIVGALISWIISISLYQSVVNKFATSGIFEFMPLNFEILRINLVIGILVSIVACIISIRRYLKV
ncbi:MAG: ABC transporter permease [Clostridiales bacterium]|nr:ABC transporter permease [Clostridiales bacterium]